MGIPKKAKKVAKQQPEDDNGEVKAKRNGCDPEIAKLIAEKYRPLWQAIGAVGQHFEVVSPVDARKVSGYIRSLVATRTKERLAEKAAFRAEQKKDRLAARKARLLEQLNVINAELGA